jgi:hypothetical protein
MMMMAGVVMMETKIVQGEGLFTGIPYMATGKGLSMGMP